MTVPRGAGRPELGRLQTAFRTDHRSDDPAADLRALVYVLDAQETLPSFQRLRDWAMGRLAPAEGETAVDVGTGTGAVACALAAGSVPPGERSGSSRTRRCAGSRGTLGDRPVPPVLVDGDASAASRTRGRRPHSERVWQTPGAPRACGS